MAESPKSGRPGPLTDLKVLDLAGPIGAYCGKLLADLGADVVRIEPPGGDPMRDIGPFFDDDPEPEKSLYWWHFNTSKRGITLDLENPEGLEIFKRLVQWADIGVETFTPGYLDKLGLNFQTIHVLNPEFILTSITPFGQTGPYSQFKGPDIIGQAMGGMIQVVGFPDRPPYLIGTEMGFWSVSVFAANATMLAVTSRDFTGEGQHIDASMQRAMTLGIGNAMPTYDVEGHVLHRGEIFARGRGGVRTVFRCKDGYVFYIAAAAGTSMEAIRDLLNENGLGDEFDPRWLDPTLLRQQGVDKDRFEALVEKFFLLHTRMELLEMSFSRTPPVFAVPTGTAQDVVESPQSAARGFIVTLEHPELDESIQYPGAPYVLPKSPWRLSRRAPLIGEHNSEVFQEALQLDEAELSRLMQDGVV
ncbi:MAG TPA: CoA transferase [Dehalococcoidia bacterium]|nr:CoA transferase [Dehalococcoidia bacterium]